MAVRTVKITADHDPNLSHWEVQGALLATSAQAVINQATTLQTAVRQLNVQVNKVESNAHCTVPIGADADGTKFNGALVAEYVTSARFVVDLNAKLLALDGRSGSILAIRTSVDVPWSKGAPGLAPDGAAPTQDFDLVDRGGGEYSLKLKAALADTATAQGTLLLTPFTFINQSEIFVSSLIDFVPPNKAGEPSPIGDLDMNWKLTTTFTTDSVDNPSVTAAWELITNGDDFLKSKTTIKKDAVGVTVIPLGADSAGTEPGLIRSFFQLAADPSESIFMVGGFMRDSDRILIAGNAFIESIFPVDRLRNADLRDAKLVIDVTNNSGAGKNAGDHVADVWAQSGGAIIL